MKKSILLLLLAFCACSVNEQPLPESSAKECRYVSVGVNLDQNQVKSVIDPGAEAFQSAILYAINPSNGRIMTYGSNAGNLSGTPLYIQTESKSFSWPLPEATPIKIYCIINPPSDFMTGINPSGLTESDLTSMMFVCSGPDALRNLSGGLPMTGVLEVDEWQITGDDASLSIPVKNIFAKYHFSLDLSELESGESLSVTKLSVSRGNTSLPYFGDGYCQRSTSLLKDFDYATQAQLATLSKGGPANGVDIYVLENCHGTHSGASSWWTVYKDLYHRWPEIGQCTGIILSYSITDGSGIINSYASHIFLGAGNMVDDFNVRRNLYKSIVIKANRRTGDMDPYLSFSADNYYFSPGTVNTAQYGSNIYQISLEATSPQIWITDSNGISTSDFTIVENDVSSGTVQIRASAGCALGAQYWLCGGVRSSFFWPPYSSNAQPFTERRKIMMVQSRALSFDAPDTDIYPYMEANYISRERFSQAVAQEIAASVRLTYLGGSLYPYLTSVSVTPVNGEYAIKVTLVPTKPGEISFAARYGESGDTVSGPTVMVQTPVLKATGNMHTDVKGTRSPMVWTLMDQSGSTPLPQPVRSGTFRIGTRDSYGTELKVETTSSESTSCTTSLYVAGFGGLPGFDPENYTFNGVDIPVEGSYIYPGGYIVSSTAVFHLDNPLAGYSYDGHTYDYCVMQGTSAQPAFVSVTQSSYKVENMMRWPQRQFTVDMTRGGTRTCNGIEVWTEYSGIPDLEPFEVSNGRVSLNEDLSLWGPVYYGRRVTNSVSGELVEFVHSVIRVYSHYNVFASFDAQEKNRVRIDWDDQGNINWSPVMLFDYHFGSFQARMVSNVSQAPLWEAIASLLLTDISSSTRAKPILNGFALYSQNLMGHGTYTDGLHDTYQLYRGDYNGSNKSYMLGHYDRPSEFGYDINYDWVYYEGVDDSTDFLYWRLIAACNKPWFKIGTGNKSVNGAFITKVQKNAAGDYCFNVLTSNANQSFYLDHEGLGYLRLCPWWEGKEGRVMVQSRDLHPNTYYNGPLCIVNGWYDPRPYANGVPRLTEKVGMYFFPESTKVNTRSGFPAYYSDDWPYPESSSRGFMEISLFSHLSFGDLFDRDEKATK